MKKRVLSMLMALALCLTLLPAPAWAAEANAPEGGTIVQEEQQEKTPAAESPAILGQAAENGIAAQNGGDSTVENAVAEVTSGSTITQYDDINKAITAAQNSEGSTVKLLADVTTTSEIEVDSGTFTIDLNGKKLDRTSPFTLSVKENGNVTVTSTQGTGTISSAQNTAIFVNDNATVHVTKGVRLNRLYTMTNANLTLDVGVIITEKISTKADNIAPFLAGKALQSCDENGTLIEGQYKSIYESYRMDDTGCVLVIEHTSHEGTPSAENPCPICGYDGTQTKPAEPVDPNPDVAEVNGTKYKTLAAAIQAANGADITLLPIVSENVVVDGDSIKAGIILGNGKTIGDIPYPSNWVADRNGIPLTMEAGEITLKDGALAQFSASSSANVAIALKGGTLIVEKTVTKIIGSNRSDSVQHAAIEVTGGVLDLQGNTLLDGGLTMSGDAQLKNKLTAGTFTNSGSDTYSVSVEGSSQYGAVFDLLETGYAFAKYDESAENKAGAIVDGSVKQLTEDVIIVAHTHSIEEGQSACACGKQFEAGIPADDGTITYYETIDEAFANVKANETVKLMIDSDDWSRTNYIYVGGGPYTFDLNGHRVGHRTGDDFNQAFLQVGDPDGNPGTLTVLDSSAAQNGYFYELELYNGSLTVESGSFYRYWESAPTATGTMTFKGGTVDVFTVTSRNVETKISGGTFGLVENNIGGKPGDLLADNRAFFNRDNDNFVNGYDDKYSAVKDVVVKEHTHNIVDGSCACGFSCPHNDFKDGKCTICGNGCAHTNVDENGLCPNCKTQMAVKSETGGIVTYGTDFKAAMNAAVDGTTVTLLADIEWGVAPKDRATITGDGKIVTLNLNGHTITGGWLDIGSNDNPTSCTLKIIGKGSHESLGGSGGYSGVFPKATLDLSEWEGGTINAINISDNSNYEAETREAAVIVGPNAGTIGKLTFGNNQLNELKKTKLSGGSFNEIWVAGFGPVKLGELLAEGYAYQYTDGVDRFVEYTKTLQGESIYNVKVVKCLHPNMKPDAATGIATCEYCGKSGKFVASVDGNLYTADQWKDAFKAWLGDAEDEKANGILKLYTDYEAEAADATWSVGYRPNGNTLDLNGHMMSVQGDGAFFKPANNMHLTVTDGTERGQITNILLDGSQRGSFTLESGYVGNLEMTGGAVVTLKGGRVDKLDVQKNTANTNLSIQGGSLGKLNIKDWADDMHVSATGGSLGAYTLPSGKILADVLDHQYYAEGTSLDKQADAAQPIEKFVINQAPHDFGSTSKAANVPINGSIPFMVDSPSENVGVYDVKWYRRTNSGAEHMVENKVADVNVGDRLDVFCVITGLDRPGGAMQWQVAVKDYTINVVPAKLNGDQTVIRQKPNTGNTGNSADNRLVVTPFSSSTFNDVEYKFEVTYNRQPLELNKDYTIKDSSNLAKNAGTHTLTIEGMGNYTGEKSVTWTLEPYELSVENFCHAQINKAYDGTDAVTDSTNGIDELGGFMLDSKNPRNPILSTVDNLNLDKSDYELSNMKFDSAEAGDRTFTGTMTLKPDGNFVFAGGSRVMQIEYGSNGSGRVSVSINRAIIAAPAAKALQVANNHAATYTVDLSALLPALEAPREYGAVTYGAPTVNLSSGYYTEGARVEDGKLILPIQAVETKETGSIGSVKVNVSTTNYHDFTLTINVSAKNRITPVLAGTLTLTPIKITYGEPLSKIKITGTMKAGDTVVEGTFSWQQPGDTILDASTSGHTVGWTFTPKDGNTYTEVTGTAMVEVDKAQQNGKVSMAGYTYGQAPSTPTLTNRTGDANPQVTYRYSAAGSGSVQTWDIQNPPALNAGTYRMYASIGDTDNYYGCEAVYCEFVVAKATPTCTKPTGLTAIYGQTLADVTLPGGWSWMDSSESVGGASTAAKTFQAKFTPKDTENYNTVENIELEVTVNKADGGNLKTVELEQKYTDASEHTYTPDWAGLPAGQDWTFSSEASIVLPKQDFAADGSLLTYAISGGKVGDKITITLRASCDNYEDFTITLTITLTAKDDQAALTLTGGTTVVYGQTLQLGTSGGNGNGAVTYAVTNGTGEATIDATGKLTPVKVGKVKVSATKAGDASYNSIISSPVEITITRATPTGEPAYTKITASGKTLADAALGIGTITPAGGTIAWDDPTTTEVVANKSYGWTYTPTDTNYTTRTGTIKLWSKSSGGGSGRTAAVVAPDMPMLYRGCTGDAVKTLQEKLNAKGFDSGNVDGIFGAKTYAAVTAFQKANGLGVDGIVGKLTWGKLYDATPVNVTPVTTQPMLRTGSRGDAVRKLQELLNALGYDCGSVDGIFGSKTKAAVLAFQKANGLGADGIVGPLTWGKLV